MSAPQGGERPILEVRDLSTWFYTRDGVVRAVNDVSFTLGEKETLCVVGESGCGKSVTALSILGLLPMPPARIESGEILFGGENLLEVGEERMRDIRGNQISMIFQEPMTSLNPVMNVGDQITEAIVLHQDLSRKEATDRAVEMLELVHMPESRRRMKQYPHQLSGGMRQRVMIAMALSCNPAVLVADEPTTALDVTIQAQILNLMLELKDRLNTAIIMITHDLGVVAETAQRVIVMYAGRKVEEASVESLFGSPQHPYTLGLMRSIPKLNEAASDDMDARLHEIAGTVPSLRQEIVGCAFAPRCKFSTEQCLRSAPVFEEKAPGHFAACHESAQIARADEA